MSLATRAHTRASHTQAQHPFASMGAAGRPHGGERAANRGQQLTCGRLGAAAPPQPEHQTRAPPLHE